MKKGLRFWLKSSSLIKMFDGDVVEILSFMGGG